MPLAFRFAALLVPLFGTPAGTCPKSCPALPRRPAVQGRTGAVLPCRDALEPSCRAGIRSTSTAGRDALEPSCRAGTRSTSTAGRDALERRRAAGTVLHDRITLASRIMFASCRPLQCGRSRPSTYVDVRPLQCGRSHPAMQGPAARRRPAGTPWSRCGPRRPEPIPPAGTRPALERPGNGEPERVLPWSRCGPRRPERVLPRVYHNHVKPHLGLDGKRPSEAAGIRIEGDSKWKTLIQAAAKSNI